MSMLELAPRCPLCGGLLMPDPVTRQDNGNARWDCERCWMSFSAKELLELACEKR